METNIPLRVKALRAALERMPDEAWVVVEGRGPATIIWAEPFANEPFVLIRRPEPEKVEPFYGG